MMEIPLRSFFIQVSLLHLSQCLQTLHWRPWLTRYAVEMCSACLTAATGDTDIGLGTLMGGQEFDIIANSSQPCK